MAEGKNVSRLSFLEHITILSSLHLRLDVIEVSTYSSVEGEPLHPLSLHNPV